MDRRAAVGKAWHLVLSVLHDDNQVIPLTEDVLIDNLWIGKSWARDPGWHQFTADSSTCNYFVSERDAWKSLRVSNQIAANTSSAAGSTESFVPDTISKRTAIPPIFFYLIFLLASAFIWLAPKI
jgi:hypothetical protein